MHQVKSKFLHAGVCISAGLRLRSCAGSRRGRVTTPAPWLSSAELRPLASSIRRCSLQLPTPHICPPLTSAHPSHLQRAALDSALPRHAHGHVCSGLATRACLSSVPLCLTSLTATPLGRGRFSLQPEGRLRAQVPAPQSAPGIPRPGRHITPSSSMSPVVLSGRRRGWPWA